MDINFALRNFAKNRNIFAKFRESAKFQRYMYV
jgi:hypothetical protein